MTATRERHSFKICVAVWGEKYVTGFEQLALASMLAPGNLPALAQAGDVEFVILTNKESIPFFEAGLTVALAGVYAGVRYLPIDDLIVPGSYSVTLTLAFTRAVTSFGEEQTRHSFIFWNADFVMSDGTLREVARRCDAGERVIMAGSLRVDEEAVRPQLERESALNHGVIEKSGRELARIAFEHAHITTRAKTINQSILHSLAPTHLIWQGEDEAVVRFYQIFMLCLRPTRALRSINGYCDYSFVPEFCPGEPVCVVQDSDQAMILEFQHSRQESQLIGIGPASVTMVARFMREWLTPEHRAAGALPVRVHWADGSDEHAALLAESEEYNQKLQSEIGTAVSHRGHNYWVSGVTSWLFDRAERGLGVEVPPEIDTTLPAAALRERSLADVWEQKRTWAGSRRSNAARLFQGVFGEPPSTNFLHPDRAAHDQIRRSLVEASRILDADKSARLLIVATPEPWVAALLPEHRGRVDFVNADFLRVFELTGERVYDQVIAIIEHRDRISLRRAVGALEHVVKPQARITMHVVKWMKHHDTDWLKSPAYALPKRIGACMRVVSIQALPNAHRHELVYGSRLAYARASFQSENVLERLHAVARTLRAVILSRISAAFAKQPSRECSGLLVEVVHEERKQGTG